MLLCCDPILPANNKLDDICENSIQHQSQSHSWRKAGVKFMQWSVHKSDSNWKIRGL